MLVVREWRNIYYICIYAYKCIYVYRYIFMYTDMYTDMYMSMMLQIYSGLKRKPKKKKFDFC